MEVPLQTTTSLAFLVRPQVRSEHVRSDQSLSGQIRACQVRSEYVRSDQAAHFRSSQGMFRTDKPSQHPLSTHVFPMISSLPGATVLPKSRVAKLLVLVAQFGRGGRLTVAEKNALKTLTVTQNPVPPSLSCPADTPLLVTSPSPTLFPLSFRFDTTFSHSPLSPSWLPWLSLTLSGMRRISLTPSRNSPTSPTTEPLTLPPFPV